MGLKGWQPPTAGPANPVVFYTCASSPWIPMVPMLKNYYIVNTPIGSGLVLVLEPVTMRRR